MIEQNNEVDLALATQVLQWVRVPNDDTMSECKHTVMFYSQKEVIHGTPYAAYKDDDGKQWYAHTFQRWSPTGNDRDALDVYLALAKRTDKIGCIDVYMQPENCDIHKSWSCTIIDCGEAFYTANANTWREVIIQAACELFDIDCSEVIYTPEVKQ